MRNARMLMSFILMVTLLFPLSSFADIPLSDNNIHNLTIYQGLVDAYSADSTNSEYENMLLQARTNTSFSMLVDFKNYYDADKSLGDLFKLRKRYVTLISRNKQKTEKENTFTLSTVSKYDAYNKLTTISKGSTVLVTCKVINSSGEVDVTDVVTITKPNIANVSKRLNKVTETDFYSSLNVNKSLKLFRLLYSTDGYLCETDSINKVINNELKKNHSVINDISLLADCKRLTEANKLSKTAKGIIAEDTVDMSPAIPESRELLNMIETVQPIYVAAYSFKTGTVLAEYSDTQYMSSVLKNKANISYKAVSRNKEYAGVNILSTNDFSTTVLVKGDLTSGIDYVIIYLSVLK